MIKNIWLLKLLAIIDLKTNFIYMIASYTFLRNFAKQIQPSHHKRDEWKHEQYEHYTMMSLLENFYRSIFVPR